MTNPIENQKSKIENQDDTGLPLLSTWPAVYTVVLGTFIVVVALLTFLTIWGKIGSGGGAK